MFPQTTGAFGRSFVAALACAAVLLPASVLAEQTGAYSCPVLGTKIETISKDTLSSDYKGVRYYFCCNSCKPQFEKDPSKFLKDSKNKDKVIGASLFDPVTTKRIDPQKAAAHRDYNGVRYFFANADDQKTFDKEPKKYATVPDMDVLFCPVSNAKIASYEKAYNYSDYKGTRYYFCCDGCKPTFDKNPDKYLTDLDTRMKAKEQPQKDTGGSQDGS